MVSGIQASQWSGAQLQAFAEANAITTHAARSYSEAVSDLPPEALALVLATELHDDDGYANAMFAEGAELFGEADAKFAEGRVASERGDAFELAGLLFTIALFFSGLALVFKSDARWYFIGLGGLAFVATVGYMATLTWT